MITLLLYMLRLLPFLCGGHRQLAIENLALTSATCRVQKDGDPPPDPHDGSPLLVALARVWNGSRHPFCS
jgi:hypothetical protein